MTMPPPMPRKPDRILMVKLSNRTSTAMTIPISLFARLKESPRVFPHYLPYIAVKPGDRIEGLILLDHIDPVNYNTNA
jgi:hypothetical protein